MALLVPRASPIPWCYSNYDKTQRQKPSTEQLSPAACNESLAWSFVESLKKHLQRTPGDILFQAATMHWHTRRTLFAFCWENVGPRLEQDNLPRSVRGQQKNDPIWNVRLIIFTESCIALKLWLLVVLKSSPICKVGCSFWHDVLYCSRGRGQIRSQALRHIG